ncbi:MAG: NfeD family protein [Nocardioides sp.]|nr:NfeD family protein [Nocardioides sp.]
MWSVFWLVVAVLLGVAEALTMTLAFAFVAGGALLAAVSAGLGAPLLVQAGVFAVTGGVSVVAVRPVARRHLSLPPPSRDGTDALIGRQAVVLSEVSLDHGLVRLGGEDWTARPYDDDLVIPVGARVDVLQIAGATVLVHPRDVLPLSQPEGA